MKTIIVDHDCHEDEIPDHGRFNAIIPLLKSRGCTDIIKAAAIPDYLDGDYKIRYLVTPIMPKYSDDDTDQVWLKEIVYGISDEIKELANAGKLHISYFVGEIITLTPAEVLEETNKILIEAGLNKDAITVYIPNFELPILQVSHIKFISIFEMSYRESLQHYEDAGQYRHPDRKSLSMKDNIIQTVNIGRRRKKYTCLNHWSKTHRECIAASLFNSGKHLDGYFSYHLNNYTIAGQPYNQGIDVTQFEAAQPFLIDTSDDEVVNHHWHVIKKFFNDAYWNIVTESFYADYHTLTEKTFKPIVNLQPFIIVGAPGSLRQLHELGYETFGSVIDESYDDVDDHDDRMRKLIRLSCYLADMSHPDHIAIQKEIKPILEHNQKVFFAKGWEEML